MLSAIEALIMVYTCLQLKCLQQSQWQVAVCNHALELASVFPLNYPREVLQFPRQCAGLSVHCRRVHWGEKYWILLSPVPRVLFSFLRIAQNFFHLFGHCMKTAESCQHLHVLLQGQNTKREIASLRENNIHALSSSQHRLRKLNVKMCQE